MTKHLFGSIILVIMLLFVLGCSGGSGDGDGGRLNIPSREPSLNQNDVNREPTSGENLANVSVTQNNLDNFTAKLSAALSGSSRNSRSIRSVGNENENVGCRAARSSRPGQFWKETGDWREAVIYRGDVSGDANVLWEGAFDWNETERTFSERWFESGRFIYNEFSNTGDLFLSGAIGYLQSEIETATSSTETFRVNGRINFRGDFRGSVVFDNLVVTEEWREDRWGDWNLVSRNQTGRWFIESGGRQIDMELGNWDCCFGCDMNNWIFPNSDRRDMGDAPNMRMPDVPTAPRGSLGNRGGAAVNQANYLTVLELFFEERWNNDNDRWDSDKDSDRSARSNLGGQESFVYEWLGHGNFSGYQRGSDNYTSRWNHNQGMDTRTATGEFFDYSNSGRLFLGGGIGESGLGSNGRNSDNWFWSFEQITNGTIRFNGDFAGELVYDNFRYRRESGDSANNWRTTLTHVSGSVRLGGIDVTDSYLELSRNNNWNW